MLNRKMIARFTLFLLPVLLPVYGAAGDVPAQHEKLTRQAALQLAAIGYKVDLGKVAVEKASKDVIYRDMDRQQDMFFKPNHFQMMTLFFRALGLTDVEDPQVFRKQVVSAMSVSFTAYYQPDRNTFVFMENQLTRLLEHVTDPARLVTHELVHAHQDQKYDLQALYARNKATLEQVRIIHMIMEGEAEMASIAATRKAIGLSMDDLSPADLASDLEAILSGELSVIYREGREFVFDRYKAGGWPAVARCFEKPPTSMEQVLHPAKLGKDLPTVVTLPDLGLPAELDDRFGESSVYFMLLALGVDNDVAFLAAAGWDGDAFRILKAPDGARMVTWRTLWDRARDAEQFESAMQSAQGRAVRRGRVVDWVGGGSVAWIDKLQKKLGASTGSYPVVKGDAESTARIEADYEKLCRERSQVVRGWWKIARAGLAIPIFKGWEVSKVNGVDVLMNTGNATPTFNPNINVQVMPAGAGATLDMLMALNKMQLASISGITLKWIRKEKVSGVDAIRYEFHGKMGQSEELHFLGMIFLKGDRQVVVTATNFHARWPACKEEYQRLFAEMKIVVGE